MGSKRPNLANSDLYLVWKVFYFRVVSNTKSPTDVGKIKGGFAEGESLLQRCLQY